MASRPDPIPQQFQQKFDTVAAEYQVYRSMEEPDKTYRARGYFSSGELEIFRWIDKHADAQARIDLYNRAYAENPHFVQDDGTHQTERERQQLAQDFIQSLDMAKGSFSGAFGIWLGTWLAPNDPEMQVRFGELWSTVGEFASLGSDTIGAQRASSDFGSRAGKNRLEPHEPLGEGEHPGIPPGGSTYYPGNTPADGNRSEQPRGVSPPDAGITLPDDGSSSFNPADGGVSIPLDQGTTNFNPDNPDSGMALPADDGSSFNFDPGMGVPHDGSSGFNPDAGMSLPDDGSSSLNPDPGMSLPHDDGGASFNPDPGMSLPDDGSSSLNPDPGMSLPDDGNAIFHPPDVGISLPDDPNASFNPPDGGMSMPHDDGSANFSN